MNKSLTFDEYKKAYEQLLEDTGKKPTASKIRDLLGFGSYATIYKFEKQLMDELEADQEKSINNVILTNGQEQELKALIENVFKLSKTFAIKGTDEKLKAMDGIISTKDQEIDQIRWDSINIANKLDKANEEIDDLKEHNDHLQGELKQLFNNYSTAIANHLTEKEELKEVIEDLKDKNNTLNESLRSVRNELEELKELLAKERAIQKEQKEQQHQQKITRKSKTTKNDTIEED